MTNTTFETALRQRLQDLADYAIDDPDAHFALVTPADTTPIPPHRPRRVPSLVAAAVIVFCIGIGIVLIAGGNSSRRPAATVNEPTGPPINTLTISVRNFTFGTDQFHVPPGVNRIRFVSTEGTHQLVFADPELSDIHLAVTESQASTIKVDLVAGRRYSIYDDLPGHRQAGEQATITVDQPAPAQ